MACKVIRLLVYATFSGLQLGLALRDSSPNWRVAFGFTAGLMFSVSFDALLDLVVYRRRSAAMRPFEHSPRTKPRYPYP